MYDLNSFRPEHRAALRTAAMTTDQLLMPMEGRAVVYLLDMLEQAERERDAARRAISVPCWMDGRPENLIAAALDAWEWMFWLQQKGAALLSSKQQTQLTCASSDLEELIDKHLMRMQKE